MKQNRETFEPVFEEISEIAAYLWERGWAERNAGNYSVDVTGAIPKCFETGNGVRTARFEQNIECTHLAGRSFLVKATGARFRDIINNPQCNMILVGISETLDGYTVTAIGETAHATPTSEFPSHLKIHCLLRKDGRPETSVLHTHPNELIALSHIAEFRNEHELNRLLFSMHPEMKVVIPEGIGVVPYTVPGSDALADATLIALKGRRIVLWEKHGCIAVGRSAHEAFDLIDTVNKSAKIYFTCRSAAHTPEGLSDMHIDELVRAFSLDKK